MKKAVQGEVNVKIEVDVFQIWYEDSNSELGLSLEVEVWRTVGVDLRMELDRDLLNELQEVEK